MYCPKCGAEYREGYYICADCGAELVDEPEAASGAAGPAPEEEEPKFAPLVSAGDRTEYEIVRAHLEAAGIEYFPHARMMGRLRFPVLIGVLPEQWEVARTLLEDLDPEAVDLAMPAEEEELPWEEPRPAEDAARAAVEVEAAVCRNGLYLAVAGEGGLALPGGPVAPADAPEDALESACARLLAEGYGVETGGMIYAGSRMAGSTVRVLFLAPWRGGALDETQGTRWAFASEIEESTPGLGELLRRADRIRREKGW